MLRVVFAGTPTFALASLQAILASGHRVVTVLTQPDRAAGRGQKLAASPVKVCAVAAGLPLLQPSSLADAAATDALRSLQPDVMVVAAYGLILPASVLAVAPLGCLNIHASLLPRWRGAAPIVRAIQAGDSETGVCIMRMAAGLDTGPVALTLRTPITADDTAGSLHDRLAVLGAEAIVTALDALAGTGDAEPLRFVPQADEGVTYAHKVAKAEAAIDWRRDADSLARQLRAFDPQPGCHSALKRQPEASIRFFSSTVLARPSDCGSPCAGEVIAASNQGLDVACGTGVLRVHALQRAGGRRLAVADFIRGHAIEPGDFFIGPDDFLSTPSAPAI